MSTHQTKDGRWFCVWYESGKQRRKVFGRGDAARTLARQFDAAKKIERRPDVLGISVSHVCLEYHQRHPVADTTRNVDSYKFGRCILPLLGDLDAERISTRDLDQYVAQRLKDGVVHTTIAREIRLLKTALNWACRQDPPLIHRNPIEKYRFRVLTGGETIAPPTPEETAALIAAAPSHLKRAILLAWHCGMRPGKETLGITWADVDFHRKELRVLSARKGAAVVRYVPLHCDLLEAMTRWRGEDEKCTEGAISSLPVCHYKGRRIHDISTTWAKIKKRAGITRKLRPYDLRHAFASYSLRAGADLHAVSQVMGHSTPTTTLRTYQHVSRDQHVSAVAMIPSVPVDKVDNKSRMDGDENLKEKR